MLSNLKLQAVQKYQMTLFQYFVVHIIIECFKTVIFNLVELNQYVKSSV